jgi:hypothetical protein
MQKWRRNRATSPTEMDRKALFKAFGVGMQYQKLDELLSIMIQPSAALSKSGPSRWADARHLFRGLEERGRGNSHERKFTTLSQYLLMQSEYNSRVEASHGLCRSGMVVDYPFCCKVILKIITSFHS